MVTYRLIYFNARGRAEVIRYIFAYAGQQYEDFRISQADWLIYKPKTLFGQVPVLEISDGTSTLQLAQSLAIARFLANQFNLVGTTQIEKARADMIAEQIVDILNLYNAIRFELDAAVREERMNRFWEETLPYYIGLFENLFETQKTMFVAADQVTWADFSFACFFDLIGKEKRDSLFEKFECCKTIFNKVEALPEIAQWKKTRPVTEL